MKFSCEKCLLSAAIATASRAAAVKSAVPSLEGLLIEASSIVKVSGYDLKTGISTSIAADVSEPGSIVINARLFGEIVRRLPDDVVTVSSDDKFMTQIKCGMSEFNIMGVSSADYPELPSVDYQNSIYIAEKELKAMIAQTNFAVSDNEARPIHTGSLFDIEDGVMTIVSVDGYRLALRRERLNEKTEMENGSFVVPGSALNEVERIASDSEELVKITLGTKHIVFVIGDTMLISRRLEGEFLNYKNSIPKTSKYTILADRKSLIDSIERVSLIISDKIKSPVRCTFSDDILKIYTSTSLGRASDECAVTGSAEDLEIGFNNRYILDALKAAPSETLKILLTSSVSPCIIGSADDSSDFLYMILPVRLKANEN
ncbi:MAG: DNA polymerase III subunit beta [Oscillospiraceae bacterium]|nr:DNA polymerase III subunit beta [Oscillospiraceae bacterium]